MKTISIIGSTGSIGKNAIEVVLNHKGRFSVYALAAKNNVSCLVQQCIALEPKPKMVAIFDKAKKLELEEKLSQAGLKQIQVHSGQEGLIQAVTAGEVAQVLMALSGVEGLKPLMAALRAGKNIAMANKEPLVMAGGMIRELARKHQATVIPVDSEHSGIFQCLEGRKNEIPSNIFLTASGGPFLYRELSTFDHITSEEALRHPRWSMGKKISVDSATLMNKGLELIEAQALFDISPDKLKVLIHPQAIVHAVVEFRDGSQIAQLSVTDMKLPIQYALTYPGRLDFEAGKLDLTRVGSLEFLSVDLKKFPCLQLAYEAMQRGGLAPCVLNAANEAAVGAFLEEKILFTDIAKINDSVLNDYHSFIAKTSVPDLEDILNADGWARQKAGAWILTHAKNKVSA
ncbi:MAG: 1-deoxy-D-xylulose-5-phosphate reductoisomerase [Candidatus Omnitrophica bacterium]|nr:1-deoxy-D-xylulose-5-phosphate reductoisomerase [Candidatus Omnitrophota bacterium]